VSKEIDSTIRFSHTSAWQATLMNSCAQCSRAVHPKRRGDNRDCEQMESGELPLGGDGGEAFKCIKCFEAVCCPQCNKKMFREGKTGGDKAKVGDYKPLPTWARTVPTVMWKVKGHVPFEDDQLCSAKCLRAASRNKPQEKKKDSATKNCEQEQGGGGGAGAVPTPHHPPQLPPITITVDYHAPTMSTRVTRDEELCALVIVSRKLAQDNGGGGSVLTLKPHYRFSNKVPLVLHRVAQRHGTSATTQYRQNAEAVAFLAAQGTRKRAAEGSADGDTAAAGKRLRELAETKLGKMMGLRTDREATRVSSEKVIVLLGLSGRGFITYSKLHKGIVLKDKPAYVVLRDKIHRRLEVMYCKKFITQAQKSNAQSTLQRQLGIAFAVHADLCDVIADRISTLLNFDAVCYHPSMDTGCYYFTVVFDQGGDEYKIALVPRMARHPNSTQWVTVIGKMAFLSKHHSGQALDAKLNIDALMQGGWAEQYFGQQYGLAEQLMHTVQGATACTFASMHTVVIPGSSPTTDFANYYLTVSDESAIGGPSMVVLASDLSGISPADISGKWLAIAVGGNITHFVLVTAISDLAGETQAHEQDRLSSQIGFPCPAHHVWVYLDPESARGLACASSTIATAAGASWQPPPPVQSAPLFGHGGVRIKKPPLPPPPSSPKAAAIAAAAAAAAGAAAAAARPS
jgi:hypothetical protein